ncbi:MAG TPA: ChaB family protein [Acetobacteraceae bacterium]|nr:ChaB family protein [Acetobacteraceae bacterium]
MPYERNEDLPAPVQQALPEHAQDIYRAAFNNTWRRQAADLLVDEATAHRIAWAAVKRLYRKAGDRWVPKSWSQ